MIARFMHALRKAICPEAGQMPIELPPLDFSGDIDIWELSSLLIDKFPDCPIYLPDERYKLCTADDMRRFLAWDDTVLQAYQDDYYDCDDFAWRLKGNLTKYPWSALPVAVVWTNKHALNGFVDSEGTWWFIEPQNNSMQRELHPWQGTELRFIAI